MVIVHRMFRRECALLPQLVAAVPVGDVARARTIARHVREVLDMLHHHHLGEDELLWPRLSTRTRIHAELLARMESQHHVLAELLEHVATALPEWRYTPAAHTGAPLTVLLEQISHGLDEHFDEEEATILPIVERVITAAEYLEVGQRGLQSIPLTRRLIMLGYLLEDTTPRERADFLAAVPAPATIRLPPHRTTPTPTRGHQTPRPTPRCLNRTEIDVRPRPVSPIAVECRAITPIHPFYRRQTS